jgi:hypothetical protein
MFTVANATGNRSLIIQCNQMPAFVIHRGGMTMVSVEFPAGDSPVIKIDSPPHSLHVGEDLPVTP